MRFGVIADIHGNLPALAAVCQAMGPVDGLLCAGDIVGYNPWPAACLNRVRELEAVTVQGNHDHAVASDGGQGFNSMAKAGVDYARHQLDEAAIEWLASLPTEQFVADGRIHMVHGHPDDPDRYTYPADFSATMLADGVDVVIVGHTHIQEYRRFEEGIVLNPGSVGQPRDGDPRAAFAVVEIDENENENEDKNKNEDSDTRANRNKKDHRNHRVTVDCHRVEYDIDWVIEAVEDAGLPSRIGRRLHSGS